MRHYLTSLCFAIVLLLFPSISSAALYYWTGAARNNADGNKEWDNPNHWNLDGYATGTIPATGPTLGTSAGPYDDVFLTNSGTVYLGGIASPGTYQRINNLSVDGGTNGIGGRYTTSTPDLRVDGDFTVADNAKFFTGPYSPNQVDFYGAFTVGNGSAIGVNNNNSDSGYWNLADATSIALGGTTIRYMTSNWSWNPPRWDFGTAPITLANTNTFNLPQDVVNPARSGIDSRGSLQQSITNTITGTGGITKTGAATLILDNTANDYDGATTISAGILQANGGGAIGDLSAVTLANAQSSANEGSVKATLSLGASETIGSLAGGGTTGGNVILNGNTLTTGGNGDSTTFAGVIAGSATGATQGVRANQGTSWNQEPYAPVGHLYAPEPALGAGGLVKTGSGTLTLSGVNTYTGTTTIDNGTIRLAGGSDRIFTNNYMRINSNGTFDLNGQDQTLRSISLANGTVLLGDGATLTIGHSGDLWGGSTLSGTGGLVKTGAGTLTFGPNATYDGGTVINEGRLSLYAGSNRLPTDGDIQVTGSGIFDLNYYDNANRVHTIDELSGDGTVWLAGASLVLGSQGGSSEFSGQIIEGTYNIRYGDTMVDGTLTKTGAGTLTLSGDSSYTGATDVNGGTLIVNGSIASSVLTSVAASAILGGSGELGVTSVAGTVTPGESAGTLSTADLTLLDASVLEFELGPPGIVGGGVNDLIDVTGDLDVDDGMITLDVIPLSGFDVGTYTLITFSGSIFGDEGNFQFSSAPAGLAGYQLIVNSFTTGGGNVQLLAVPEPSAFALAALGFLSLGLVGRRRKKR